VRGKMAKKILIVDDEKRFHEMYSMMLGDKSYDLTFAYDGDEAMQILWDNKPDLIILDMIMDMVTGDTFFLYLKSDDLSADIPVVIISSTPLKKYKSLKKIDPNLLYIDKADLTKERLLEIVEKELVA
jgi:CheY-like chemotaxis protein